MFFKNYLIVLFLKFLWWGICFGFFAIIPSLVIKATKRNIYVFNLMSFCFTLLFGVVFAQLSLNYFNYSFCWFGLVGMVLGCFLVKISVEFLFTKFIKLLYNKLTKLKERKTDSGKLCSNQKG